MNFFPHRFCIANTPLLLWMTLWGNLVIGLAYYVIAVRLYLLAKRYMIGPIVGRTIWFMFASFIIACGTTHFFDAWVLFYPQYWGQIYVTLLTAGLSLATAIILVPKSIALLKGNHSPRERFVAHQSIEHLDNIQEMSAILAKRGLLERRRTPR